MGTAEAAKINRPLLEIEEEECHPSADDLPLASPLNGSWAVVDEGGHKGVHKLGLLSRQVGDTIDLLPWRGPTNCRWLKVQLGYLVSAKRPTLGGIHIDCIGCQCASFRTPFPKLYPFPDIQTYAYYNDDPTYADGNMTVTAMTTFYAAGDPDPSKKCTVRLTHTPIDLGHRVWKLYRRTPMVPDELLANHEIHNLSEIRCGRPDQE